MEQDHQKIDNKTWDKVFANPSVRKDIENVMETSHNFAVIKHCVLEILNKKIGLEKQKNADPDLLESVKKAWDGLDSLYFKANVLHEVNSEKLIQSFGKVLKAEGKEITSPDFRKSISELYEDDNAIKKSVPDATSTFSDQLLISRELIEEFYAQANARGKGIFFREIGADAEVSGVREILIKADLQLKSDGANGLDQQIAKINTYKQLAQDAAKPLNIVISDDVWDRVFKNPVANEALATFEKKCRCNVSSEYMMKIGIEDNLIHKLRIPIGFDEKWFDQIFAVDEQLHHIIFSLVKKESPSLCNGVEGDDIKESVFYEFIEQAEKRGKFKNINESVLSKELIERIYSKSEKLPVGDSIAQSFQIVIDELYQDLFNAMQKANKAARDIGITKPSDSLYSVHEVKKNDPKRQL
jgi:hypothetical protein